MSEWHDIIFEKLSKVQGGFAFKSDDYKDEGSLLVRIGNLQNGRINKINSVYINTEFKTYGEFILKESDILIGLTGDLGKIAIVCREDLPALLNQRVGRFIPKIEVDSNYIYHLISSQYFIEKLKIFFEGGAQANISPKQIEAVKVNVPKDKSEQTRIAEIISTADEAIVQTKVLIAKYQRIKTGLMQDLLTKGIDANGNIRSKLTHKFVVKNGIEVPEDWEVDTLENITRATITYGIVQAGPDIPNGIPYIRTGDMSGDFLTDKGLLRTSFEIASKFKRSQVEEGDIVFALRATIGKVLIVPKELNGANLTQGTARIAPNLGTINNLYLLWTMRMYYFANQILQIQKGTTFFEITLGELRKMIVSFPKNIYEQISIINTLERQESSILNLKSNLNKLQCLKTGLMQDLLSGKVRVNIDNKN